MAMFALPEALFLVLNPARGANGESGSGKITGLRISREEGAR
jgi:putative tricarboxylic transport membrane protein